ncbi:hypothetical protein JXA48_00230 [Candidatus Woesearchaeota archaeon]|nr:hypothetical protein [Candidatus Woesearchaeota archaeon]
MSELFKHDYLTVELSETPSVKGHLVVKNSKSLGLCNDVETLAFFSATSQCATALFELIGAHGTNIIIQEKDDSLYADILARMQNDGLDFLWQPIRGDPIELDSVAKSIKDEIDILMWQKQNPDQVATKSSSAPQVIKQESPNESGEKKDNYLLKKLNRTP